ncbi:MAG: hypothetical protein JSW61_13285 [Candidatus Thorarchaeota archaeon]|nr:MAG: hypothetical protein JSW61_13285 [Candidatus Thorarchaeota archaeon]
MTWVALLLANRSQVLRRLVLTELLGRSENDPEVRELDSILEDDPLLGPLLGKQSHDGSWKETDYGDYSSKNKIRATSFVLQRLAYAGLSSDHPAIRKGVEYIFSKQHRDGSWSVPQSYDGVSLDGGAYTMIPLQTSIPLLGISASGHSEDERAELAYDWLTERRLDDGSWPTGMIGNVFGYQAGYRRMPNSQWGCRTNTTLALSCLGYHPRRSKSEEARRALNMLLVRETRDRQNVGFNVARTVGYEPHRGHFTYHARFDPALILDLSWRMGADTSDSRVADLVDWFSDIQGSYGIWEYVPRPEVSHWVTFDILRSLSKTDMNQDWVTEEVRTPFRAYRRKRKRF